MNKLFIHIGTFKTGSTPLQSWLDVNKEAFKADDVHYIPGFHNYRKSFRSYNEDHIQEISKFLKGSIGNSKNKKFVVSTEHLAGFPLEGYGNSATVAKNLRKLTDLLDVDVSIIVYIRRQDDFFESLYTQYVHIGEAYRFERFYELYGGVDFNWLNVLDNYAGEFGKEKLIVRSYDKLYLPVAQSIFDDFGAIIGLSKKTIASAKPAQVPNLGYSRDALEVALICNRDLSKDDKLRLRVMLQNSNAKGIFDKYAYFTPEGRLEFMSRFVASNEEILKRYFPEGTTRLFTEVPTHSNAYPGLDINALAKVLINIELNNQRKTQQNSSVIKWIIRMENRVKRLLRKSGKK